MDIAHKRKRKEARKLFLAGECATNAEIARRLGLKPHTVARYRKEEDWDALRLKAERRAAEKMVEQMANERVSLNVRHYNYFEFILAEMGNTLKGQGRFSADQLAQFVTIVERVQKGQRLARGLSMTGETEQEIRAQAEAEHRALVDAFVDAVKDHISDEIVREKIGAAVMAKFPAGAVDGADSADEAP